MANGPATPLPGWIGTAVQITTQVGIPTVFALVLLWFVLFRFENSMGKITDRLEKNADFLKHFTDTEAHQLIEMHKQTVALEHIARQHKEK